MQRGRLELDLLESASQRKLKPGHMQADFFLNDDLGGNTSLSAFNYLVQSLKLQQLKLLKIYPYLRTNRGLGRDGGDGDSYRVAARNSTRNSYRS